MVKERVVDRTGDVSQFADRLFAEGLHVDVAAWVLDEESQEFRLFLAIRELDDLGPLSVVRTIRDEIASNPQLKLNPDEVYVLSTAQPFVQQLRAMIKVTYPGSFVHFVNNRFNDVLFPEIFILWTTGRA